MLPSHYQINEILRSKIILYKIRVFDKFKIMLTKLRLDLLVIH